MKPVVKYRVFLPGHIVVGSRAIVFAIDHYNPMIPPNELVNTSTVQTYDEATGEFETLNTKYVLAVN